MIELKWLRQTSCDVPAHDEWLCATERQRLAQLLVPKRRADWRLGRWTIKRAAASYFGLPQDLSCFASIAVRPAQSGAPRVFIDGKAAEIAVSLSHCDGVAICTLAPPPALLGCDLEKVEPRAETFVSDYFTPGEQDIVASCESPELRASMITLIWCAKEAVLKALEIGLRADTRSLDVSFTAGTLCEASWHSVAVYAKQNSFRGWWKQECQLLYCFASDQPLALAQPLPIESVSEAILPVGRNRATSTAAL